MLRWNRRLTRAGTAAAFATVVLALATAGAMPAPAATTSSPTLVSTTRATTSGAVSLSITRPSTSPTNLLLAAIDARVDANVAITPPVGWVLIRRDSVTSGSQSLSQALYYKIAGSSEPLSYTWSLNQKGSVAGAILVYSGVDTSLPIDAHSGAAIPSGKSVSAPAISIGTANERVVAIFGDVSGKSLSTPSALAARYQVSAKSPRGDLGPASAGADAEIASTGTTNAFSASAAGGTTPMAGQVVALRPAVMLVAAPSNYAAPTIAGTTEVGQTLTASPGTWTSNETPVYAFQWRQCDSAGANCVNLSGATAKTYTLAAADAGRTMRVLVTATNSEGSASAQSPASSVVASSPAPAPAPSPDPTPSPSPDRWFSGDSPLNAPIVAGAEIDPASQAMVQNLITEAQKSGWSISVKRWSTPVYYADSSTPTQNVPMTASWAAASTLYGVPVPANAQPDPSSDGHMAIINRDNGCYYEFYRASRGADGILSAGWGNRERLDGTGIYPHSWSTRDSGFANFTGLIRPEELQAGAIEHALSFSTMYSAKAAVPPATAWGGAPLTAPAGTLPIPYGAHLQLDPSLNLDGLSLAPWQKTVARALQKYGMYMADTGGFSLGAVNPQGYPTNPYTPFWGDGDYSYLPSSLVSHLRVLKLPAAWSPDRYVVNDSPCGTLK